MSSYGSLQGNTLRRAIRSEVALDYPSVVQYRRILTPFQEAQAKAGQFYFGSPLTSEAKTYIPLLILAALILKR